MNLLKFNEMAVDTICRYSPTPPMLEPWRKQFMDSRTTYQKMEVLKTYRILEAVYEWGDEYQ